jgi:hypothetical protein
MWMKTLCQRAAHILSIMNSQAMASYHALRLHRSIPLQYADPSKLRFRADTKTFSGEWEGPSVTLTPGA